MKIRKLTVSEIPKFMKLYESIVWSDFPDWSDKSKQVWIDSDYSSKFWATSVGEKNYPVLVMVEDGIFVGYVAIESINFGVAYLGWIGVLPSHRGRGVARELLKRLIAECKNKGLHKIELETQLTELLPFFLKQGFSLEGVRNNSWQKLDNFMFGKLI